MTVKKLCDRLSRFPGDIEIMIRYEGSVVASIESIYLLKDQKLDYVLVLDEEKVR